MKLAFLSTLLFLSITFSLAVSKAPKIPSKIEGFDSFTPADVKANPLMLNAFLSKTSEFVIKAINARKFAPSDYGVIMRSAFRAAKSNGYEIIYYVKAHEPGNDKAKDYYAHFTVTVGLYGSNKKLGDYTIDAVLPHSKN